MQQGAQELSTTGKAENENPRCYKRYITMLRCLGEVFAVVLLITTSYANLQKGALKIQFQPPPVPFLYPNSSVDDFYGGEIATPFTTVVNSDVSVVMYYAPWDFDSQLTRKVLDQIALKYENQVYFSAVNCWVQTGECKQLISKLRSFPVILGYIGGNNGIQFRGPLQFNYIDSFVQQLIKPYERIESSHDIFHLLATSTGVVTGYFNFSDSKPLGFYPFYVASLKYLEYDVHRSTKFAVITNSKAASELGIPHLSSSAPYDIRLHLWNETLIYPRNASGIDVSRFLQWIYYRSHSPVQWIWPSGRKSQIIQHYLADQGRPSFVLFTRKLQTSEQYLMLKEAALDYHNCASSARIERLAKEILIARQTIEEERLILASQCSIHENEECNPHLSNNTKRSCEELATQSEIKFRGLGCRTNKTLNFYLLDSEQYPNFIFKLGYTEKDYHLNTNAAVIIDPQGESFYRLNEPLTTKSIRQLILNFTNRALTPFRRSANQSNECAESRLCIESVTSSQFHTVLDPAYDTIVYYFKDGCIFCDAGARVFLRLSQMFTLAVENQVNSTLRGIRFTTVNAEDNDLQWQFTVERYPTIVFYPAERKIDSRMFPHELELNVANLLNFTLSQLTLRQRVLWFVQFCKEPACLQEAKRQIDTQSSMIDQHIRTLRYRMSLSELDDVSLMQDLRAWMKEQYFYKELEYSVVKTLSDLKLRNRELYPEGVRFSYIE